MYFLFGLIGITVYTATECTYFHVLNTSTLQPHCFCLPLFVDGSTHLTLLTTLCWSLHNWEPAAGHFLLTAPHIWHCFMLITTQPTACYWPLFVNGSTHLTLLMLITIQLTACCWSCFVDSSTHLTLLYAYHYTTESLLLATFCQWLHTSDIALCWSLHNRQPAAGHVLLITTQQLVIWFPFVFQHLQRKFKIPLLWDPYQARFPP